MADGGHPADVLIERNRAQAAATQAELGEFYAYMPAHQYIYVPTGDLWPASSVDGYVNPWPKDENTSKPQRPSDWLDHHRAVEQMTWHPGMKQVLSDVVVQGGGMVAHPGAQVFNTYRPPVIERGDPHDVSMWLDHVRCIYPDEHEHIVRWLAHRVQRPGEKINHALVLGGAQGIGKDTILEPVKRAVGPWNVAEISPAQMLGRFNGYIKSVILRISEARDLGDVDRFAFYDHAKTLIAAPPDVLRCDEKHIREHPVFNVCGVIITTNHLTDGIYLPADDRRHFVAWSDVTRDTFTADYWNEVYGWFEKGGYGNVAAYLRSLDLSRFDPKAPPPKTTAFATIVHAGQAPEDSELADVIDALQTPTTLTLAQVVAKAEGLGLSQIAADLGERKNRRQIPHRMERVGYVPVHNRNAGDGLWKIDGRRQAVYGRASAAERDRQSAASRLAAGPVGRSDRSSQ